MAERQSALAGFPHGDAAAEGARLFELRPLSILQVQAFPDSLAEARDGLATLLGVEVPAAGGSAGDAVLSMGTGRFLIRADVPDLAARFEEALAADVASVTDLSHGRTVLRLEGDATTELLARCLLLDLDPSVFPAGRVAETAIHHVDVVVHRQTTTRFDLWVMRSLAEALSEWLVDAGAGLKVGFCAPPSDL